MADPTIEADDEFPRFQEKQDPLDLRGLVHRYTDVKLEGIPPTMGETHPIGEQGVTAAHKGIIAELNGVSAQSSSDDIKSLLRDCDSINLTVDINRLARFAICRNAVAVVKYLVDEKDADLIHSEDIKGRSTIFYAMWDYPDDQMFQYLGPKFRENLESLDEYADIHGLTVWSIAIALKRLDAFRFLLELDPNTKITRDIMTKWARQLDRAGLQGRSLVEAWYVQSLVGFKDVSRAVSTIGFFTVVQRKSGGAWRSQLLSRHSVVKLEAGGEYNLRWLHLPLATSLLFFPALRQVGRDLGCPTYPSDWLPSLLRQPVKVPANPNLPYTDPVYESNLGSRRTPRAFIIFPCLILRSRASQREARKGIDKLRKKIADNPAKDILQPELTLDESYFPSLSTDVIGERNNTQLVSRQCTETLDGQPTDKDTEPILMVPQLWLWRCGSHIVTAFPANEPNESKWDNRRRGEYMQYLTDFFLQRIPSSPTIQLGLLIAHQIAAFGNPQVDGGFGNPRDDVKYPSPLDIFEASIAQVLADVPQYMHLNASSSQPETERERDSLFRIADVREELAMINQVLVQQLQVLQNFIDDFERYNPDSLSFLDRGSMNKGGRLKREAMQESETDAINMQSWEEVKRSRTTIKKYQSRVKKIDADAERVEKRMQYQLNLKLTHASIDDAHASLKLGTTVMGFTVVTILFAPLAFVTALFALPIDTLLSNQVPFKRLGGTSANDTQITASYTTSYVGTWFIVAEVVSLVVTILLVVLCVWLLRGTKSLSVLQGSYFRTKPNEEIMAASGFGLEDSALVQEQPGLRRRVGKLFGRNPSQNEISTV